MNEWRPRGALCDTSLRYPAGVTEAAYHIALPIALAWMLAALFWFALGLGYRARLVIVLGLFLVMFALPFVAPAEQRLWRGIVAIACATAWIKLYDVHYGLHLAGGARDRAVPAFGRYLGFLINPCMLVYRRLDHEPQPPAKVETRRVLRGCVVALLAAPLLWWSFESARGGSWGAWPFWIEHCVKTLLVFGIVYGVCEIVTGLWRLAGFRGRTWMLNFFAARTPAEFWRLYNRPTGQFFHEDVARPVQRRFGPALATMTAFAASGVGHEYLAFVAIGKVQMLQTSFFLIQGLAVVLTQRLQPRPPSAVAYLAIALTFVFNLMTSMLFFASVNQIVPWYAAEPIIPR